MVFACGDLDSVRNQAKGPFRILNEKTGKAQCRQECANYKKRSCVEEVSVTSTRAFKMALCVLMSLKLRLEARSIFCSGAWCRSGSITRFSFHGNSFCSKRDVIR
jgi:hypothetical protein